MKRLLIWMIPILAAVSTIWIQAVIHADNPGAAFRRPTTPIEQRDTAVSKPIVPGYPDDTVKLPPRPTEPSH